MADETQSNATRKATEVILSVEEKLDLVIKTVSSQNHLIKLVLDRLNALVKQSGVNPGIVKEVPVEPQPPTKVEVVAPYVETSKEPVKLRRNTPSILPANEEKENISKIPVGQRVTDQNGKDLFMADVLITNLSTGETFNKIKTNAQGKWQMLLFPGKYSVLISKIVDPNTLSKIENLQEIEIPTKQKTFQLPNAIIQR